MEGIFHFGASSEQYIHDFESKWADYALQSLKDWTFEDLKALLCMLKKGNHTFEESGQAKV